MANDKPESRKPEIASHSSQNVDGNVAVFDQTSTPLPEWPKTLSNRQNKTMVEEAQVSRQWRPAAQRNLRNQWSKLSSLRRQWSSSSSTARSHATCLVNAYLSRIYLPSMELGVLSTDDMPRLRSKACLKLAKQQQLHRTSLLSSYRDMVSAVTQMVTSSKSMRCYLKGTSTSPLVQFSASSNYQSDSGDCGGSPVFALWSISCFEKYAVEVVQMLVLELNLKRLIVVELVSISDSANNNNNNEFKWSDELYQGEFEDLSVCQLFRGEKPNSECNPNPNQQTLHVYLTTWLAEVNIDTHRVDEIFAATGEEMHVNL